MEQLLFAFCSPKTTKQGLDSPKNGVTILELDASFQIRGRIFEGKTCIELQHVGFAGGVCGESE